MTEVPGDRLVVRGRCRRGAEESQQPTCPQVRQIRRCTPRPVSSRWSSQRPGVPGATSGAASRRCSHCWGERGARPARSSRRKRPAGGPRARRARSRLSLPPSMIDQRPDRAVGVRAGPTPAGRERGNSCSAPPTKSRHQGQGGSRARRFGAGDRPGFPGAADASARGRGARPRPGGSARSTPTSGWSGSGRRRSRCATASSTPARDGEDVGFAVRVVHDGTWGFAAGVDLTPEAVVRVAEQAVTVARVSRPGSARSRSSWPTSRSTRTSPGSRHTRWIPSRCRTGTRSDC